MSSVLTTHPNGVLLYCAYCLSYSIVKLCCPILNFTVLLHLIQGFKLLNDLKLSLSLILFHLNGHILSKRASRELSCADFIIHAHIHKYPYNYRIHKFIQFIEEEYY